jgi:hypothetical protein
MRTRTAVAAATSVLTLGGLGITVASGATPIFSADLPSPGLTLECPQTLGLGATGSLSGALMEGESTPISQSDITITRSDEYGAVPVEVGVDRTTGQGKFGPLSDTPVNRGDQTYKASFAGNETYAATSAECTTDVNGTGTQLTAAAPSAVAVGDDVDVTGRLTTAAGDPVADATITAKDAVEGTTTDLAETTTDSDGNFTVTAESVAAGHHAINFSYLGDEVMEPTTFSVEFDVDSGTMLSVDPVEARFAGADIAVTGTLTNGAGEPLAGATITGTDTLGGTASDLAEATTDSAGGFTVTVPSAAPGQHTVDLSYAGQGPNKAATGQVTFTVKHETKLTLSGPDELPADPEAVDFTITLTDGADQPVPDARVVLNDGGSWEQGTRTNADGQATYTKPGVSNGAPLRIDVTYAGDDTHWESSISRIWKGTPQFTLTRDKPRYTAGDLASLTLTASNGNVPATIELKPYRRPAVAITSSDTGETAFTHKVFRNSTLTISTDATNRWKAGSRTYTIRVAPQIKQTLVGSYDQSGDTYLVRTTRDPRLDAKVLPARPGRCVKAVVQKLVDGVYNTVQTSSCRLLDVDSTASFKLVNNPRAGAKFRMRFQSPADDMNIAGQGGWTYLRFTT